MILLNLLLLLPSIVYNVQCANTDSLQNTEACHCYSGVGVPRMCLAGQVCSVDQSGNGACSNLGHCPFQNSQTNLDQCVCGNTTGGTGSPSPTQICDPGQICDGSASNLNSSSAYCTDIAQCTNLDGISNSEACVCYMNAGAKALCEKNQICSTNTVGDGTCSFLGECMYQNGAINNASCLCGDTTCNPQQTCTSDNGKGTCGTMDQCPQVGKNAMPCKCYLENGDQNICSDNELCSYDSEGNGICTPVGKCQFQNGQTNNIYCECGSSKGGVFCNPDEVCTASGDNKGECTKVFECTENVASSRTCQCSRSNGLVAFCQTNQVCTYNMSGDGKCVNIGACKNNSPDYGHNSVVCYCNEVNNLCKANQQCNQGVCANLPVCPNVNNYEENTAECECYFKEGIKQYCPAGRYCTIDRKGNGTCSVDNPSSLSTCSVTNGMPVDSNCACVAGEGEEAICNLGDTCLVDSQGNGKCQPMQSCLMTNGNVNTVKCKCYEANCDPGYTCLVDVNSAGAAVGSCEQLSSCGVLDGTNSTACICGSSSLSGNNVCEVDYECRNTNTDTKCIYKYSTAAFLGFLISVCLL